MNKVVTMSDSKYFEYGSMFLKTRHRIDADFVLYGPDLTEEQIETLSIFNIEYKKCSQDDWDNKMQYMKFEFVKNEIDHANDDCELITFCDFDTFFVNDWSNEIYKDTNLAITIRKDMIKKKCLRAYANGGVFMVGVNKKGYELLEVITFVVSNPNTPSIITKQYNEIWNTLESEKRPEHKRHYRTNLRWWVDQVALSAFVRAGKKRFKKYNIQLLPCEKFNVLESEPTMDIEDGIYIRHMKTKSGAPANYKG